ncbi:Maf-like protein [Advenella kashmirensis WT001]|uniref:7-methyl-GTP pyrophosphatase n=1 Tax=Advenella kashmirensis (strain DSM 17095 / LMG 22695 / WT001) TaxID=1036672 RepID=I3UB71_ADVKW|nr:Maf-like protein [Advenella kashmirensis WT001]
MKTMSFSPPRLILASSSVYRKAMLQRLGLPFEAISPGIDESALPDEAPEALSQRLSLAKAQHVAVQHPGSVVIGSDQVATHDGQPIGKPGTYERAFAQLRELSGKTVAFHSALAVTNGARSAVADVVTRCVFRELTDEEIRHYLSVEKPFDTAGSAKAEGLGISLMQSMHSDDPTAIIGLPLIELSRMLRSFDLNPTLLAQPL